MEVLSDAANFPMGRRDFSRSPPRQALYEDPGRDSRYRDDLYHERGNDSRRGDYREGLSSRTPGIRTARNYPRDNHDYGGMYDEGYREEGEHRYDQHEDKMARGNPRYRHDDDQGSRSPSGRSSDSRSYSPTREAGKPSDTVILEGLSFGISASEVGTLPI